MKKSGIIIMIVILTVLISACNIANKDSVSQKTDPSSELEQELDSYEYLKNYLNSDEVKHICHISLNKNIAYYISKDNKLVHAEFNGQNVNVINKYEVDILTKNIFWSEIENSIHCLSNGKDGTHSLVFIDVKTGIIKNVLDGIDVFSGYIPDYYFNYYNGVTLFRIKDNKINDDRLYKHWGLINTNNNQTKIFDVEKIYDKYIEPENVLYKDMVLIGYDKIMVVVHSKNDRKITLIYVNFEGEVIKTFNIENDTSFMRNGLSACHVSPDGKYMLFSENQTPISLILYDIEKKTEYPIVSSADKIRTYSEWINNNTFIYQALNLKTNSKEIEKVDISQFIKN